MMAGLVAAAAVCLSAAAARAQAVDNWTSTSSGLWGTAANWSTGVPTNANAATFNSSAGLQTSMTLLPASTTGTLVLAGAGGANAYTFDSLGTENANTLTIASGITNSDTAAVTFYNTTTLGGTQTWANNGAALTFNGNVNLGSGSSGYTLTVAGAGAVNIAGTIADGGSSAGGLVYSGTGTLTLSGANTYTGATTISSGTISIQNAGALGTASNTANTTVVSGAVLQIANNITTTNGGTLVLNGTGTGSGAFQSIGGNNAWNSDVTVASNATIYSSTAGDTLTIGNAAGTSLFTMGSSTVTFDGPGDTFVNSNVGVAGDTGGLVKNGAGTLTLYGYNTYYTGPTVVNAGTMALVVGPFSAGWYGIMGSLTIGTGPANPSFAGTVNVNIWSNSYNGQISPTSAVNIKSDGALNVGSSTGLGTLTLSGGQVNISSGVSVAPTGDITSSANSAHETSLISGGALNLTTGNINVARDSTLASDLTISSSIGGTALTKTGSGVLTLSGANTYTGATSINGGTLSIGADANLGAAPGSAAVNQLNLNGGTLSTTATFALNSNRGITMNAGGGTVSAASGTTLTYGGLIAGSGSLAVPGAGTLDLTSNSLNFGGSTTFTSGTLEFSGTLPSIGTLTLGAGSTLFVNGSDLSVSDLVVSGNAIIDFGGGASILDSATFTMDPGAALTVEGWASGVDYFYAQNWTGATLGTTGVGPETQVTFNGYSSASTGWLSYDNEISPAPEPATYGAILVGISLVAVVVRRRRQSAP